MLKDEYLEADVTVSDKPTTPEEPSVTNLSNQLDVKTENVGNTLGTRQHQQRDKIG